MTINENDPQADVFTEEVEASSALAALSPATRRTIARNARHAPAVNERQESSMALHAIENVRRIAPREAAFSLYLGREVLPGKPGGIAADVVTADRIYTVSQLDGESGWTIDGESLANGLPVFFNGEGARYTLLRELCEPAIVEALNAAAAQVKS